ncbi:Palmitoyltransferase pfa3 [Xylona heveae TC161]|uniref:Palmitoyltransferase n=1 Tax=Xylona heveae (strain CBS 132557 / TC161) TaxID=1328760 RepID=A0A165JRE9_XYLHT|nr:Palmitoyltransferase pfa3 [Xylona heveae TC161]KZF26541.1 Palmitoyltransferase pfa3 [Xylona heveae TC161]
MATLASRSSSPVPPLSRRRKAWARKCERYCCLTLTYFPLAFVYGLTTWAVWVVTIIGQNSSTSDWTGFTSSTVGVAFYVLLNWSYTTAVFTDPGSPLSRKSGYSHLPMQEPRSPTSFTVKSTGELRFCKKCQSRKPDRSHHCSTCRRCVLKMDHHCPWLATCVGLRNYKAFLLFLIYTSLYCWICFAVSMTQVLRELASDAGEMVEGFMTINYVLLAVIAGIIGLVLSGFTAWHISLAFRGQTTIECLEKTRYLSPLRKSLQTASYQQHFVDSSGANTPSYSQQFMEIHANAVPGVTRPEEGEEDRSEAASPLINSPAQISLQRTYYDSERWRERQRYEDYMDEKDSEKLPNAFDLGWRRNLLHLFGERPLLWWIPICNTTGDGWSWEPSPKWLDARDRIRRDREERWRAEQERERAAGWGAEDVTGRSYTDSFSSTPSTSQRRLPPRWQPTPNGEDSHYLTTSTGGVWVPTSGQRSPGKAEQLLGRPLSPGDASGGGRPNSGVSMHTLRPFGRQDNGDDGSEEPEFDHYEVSSDEDVAK